MGVNSTAVIRVQAGQMVGSLCLYSENANNLRSVRSWHSHYRDGVDTIQKTGDDDGVWWRMWLIS